VFRIGIKPPVWKCFLTGVVPDVIWAHVERALVESPIELLAQAANELSDEEWPIIRNNLQVLAKCFKAQKRLSQWLLTNPSIISQKYFQHTTTEILAKKVFDRASDFTAWDILELAFLIEKGKAEFLKDKMYHRKLAIILRRIKRNDTRLRYFFDHITRNGYTTDYDHCVGVIRKFIANV